MEHFTEEEIRRILREFHRVLKADGPGGRLLAPGVRPERALLQGPRLGVPAPCCGKKDVKFHPDEITRVALATPRHRALRGRRLPASFDTPSARATSSPTRWWRRERRLRPSRGAMVSSLTFHRGSGRLQRMSPRTTGSRRLPCRRAPKSLVDGGGLHGPFPHRLAEPAPAHVERLEQDAGRGADEHPGRGDPEKGLSTRTGQPLPEQDESQHRRNQSGPTSQIDLRPAQHREPVAPGQHRQGKDGHGAQHRDREDARSAVRSSRRALKTAHT